MAGILAGFFVVWAVILVGMFVGRRNVLPINGQNVLNSLSFYVANPALLFEVLSRANLDHVLGFPLCVAVVSSVATASLFFMVMKHILKRTAAEALIGAMCASFPNWGNLGIPIAAFVLEDPSYVAPLILFQLAIFNPMFLLGLDAASARHQTTLPKLILIILRNPAIIGSLLGILVAGSGLDVAQLIMEPVHLIAGAAIPAMLIAFGMSLNDSVPLKAASDRLETLLAVGFKMLVHPLLALVFAKFALRLESEALFGAVVMAAMPTAQAVFVVANRYGTSIVSTKDTVLITTLSALPAVMAVALLLS